MKKLIGLYFFSSLFAVNITFQVDMQDEAVYDSVYFVNLTLFSFDSMELIKESNIYTISYDLSAGEAISYRFATDNTFNPGTIEESTRMVEVPEEDLTLDIVCYNSDISCPEDIYFPVALIFIDGSENWDNIWFQGSFDEWESSYAGTVENNIWTLELEVLQGEYEWGAFQALNDEGDQDIWLTPNITNPGFTVDSEGNISGDTTYELVAFPVDFQIIDGTTSLDSIYIKLGSTDFSYPNWDVNNYCDDSDGDHTWLCSIFLQPSALIYWKAFEVNGTDLNYLIDEDNLEFSISEDGIYDAELTTLTIPDVGEWITNSVRFEVDMTEWLDEEGSSGIPIFSVSRNDEVQVRGDWNFWSDGDASNSIMIRQPGTNIFSLPVEISYFSGAQYQYKFFIKHSEESVDTLEARFGAMDSLMNLGNWGWENAPLYGGGNRKFTLSESESIITVREGYYDLPPGGVIPEGTSLSLTYSVDMSSESLFDGDSVRIILKDKWTNYIQDFENTSVADDNLEARFDANCSGNLCTFEIEQQGPFAYYTLYNWEYKNSDGDWVTEGGAYGTYGKYRARYITPNGDFEWVDFSFPQDIFQENTPYAPEAMPVIGCTEINACNYDEAAVIDNGLCAQLDCAGECDGDAIVDGCGECDGDNSTCDTEILGCMDEVACNYDFTANVDDSSCEYALENFDCDGICMATGGNLDDGGYDCNDVCGGTDTSCLSIDKVGLPTEFEISSAYPNPFNPICQFSIANPKFSHVNISIYNLEGKLMSVLYAGHLSPGYHSFNWNAQNLQSGLYFIKVNYDNNNEVMRATLIK
ncbi:MAG: T9SS type A sorting domain-containing protein [Candidatus Marinimicrobia bacterium]|nr:T9SS type A sorting domain-containing protein [Candidatus Neomarinimicrobiota bacterium]